jgi:hypothetical protein
MEGFKTLERTIMGFQCWSANLEGVQGTPEPLFIGLALFREGVDSDWPNINDFAYDWIMYEQVDIQPRYSNVSGVGLTRYVSQNPGYVRDFHGKRKADGHFTDIALVFGTPDDFLSTRDEIFWHIQAHTRCFVLEP